MIIPVKVIGKNSMAKLVQWNKPIINKCHTHAHIPMHTPEVYIRSAFRIRWS